MIDVCVTHFGEKYSTKYLDNLEKGIAKHYSGDFNLVVKTDCQYQHWDKISFFKTDKERIIMDIDMLVANDLDALFDTKMEHSLAAFQRWWSPNKTSINGGFYKIKPGEDLDFIHNKFYKNPDMIVHKYSQRMKQKWKGEQTFVNDNLKQIQYLPNWWLGVYVKDVMHVGQKCDQEVYNAIYRKTFSRSMILDRQFGYHVKLVHFIYSDNLIEKHEQWIQDMWDLSA